MNLFFLAAGLMLFLNIAAAPRESLGVPLLSWQRAGPDIADRLVVRRRSPAPSAPIMTASDSLGVAITAGSAIVIDVRSNAVLWEKNPDEVRALASITKLAAAMVVLDRNPERDAVIEVMREDYTNLGINTMSVGETVRVKDVLATALIASDNTAMRALARSTGLSTEAFVAAMNAKAKELGLARTRFFDTTGLAAENVSTAREAAQLAQRAFSYPDVASVAGRQTYTFTAASGKEHVVRTTNQLIGSMVSVIAGKTGFVTESGYNLVSEVKRPAPAGRGDGAGLMIAVLGSTANEDRFQDVKMLAHWTWEHFQWPNL